MAEIGTQMIYSQQNYEDVFRSVMGVQNTNLKCSLEQISQLLNQIQVKISIDMQNKLRDWFSMKMDN